MPYTIDFSDPSKNSLTVNDNTINTETSIKIPGKNSLGYGQVIAENLLKLLENFASVIEPDNPVEGQLWYDNVNEQLMVFDGVKFTSAGGLQKSNSIPEVSNSVVGDIWVDKTKQQLYLFSGTEWLLIGPDYSNGLVTGVKVETILGVDNNEYNVIKMNVNNEVVAIIAFDTFVPKLFINGFSGVSIKPGFNLANRDTDNDNNNDVKYFGVSEKAESLIVNNTSVAAVNFLRSDTESTTLNPFNVRNSDGLKIGANNELSISLDSSNVVINNRADSGNITFKTTTNGVTNDTFVIDGNNNRVGINTSVPDVELEILGDVEIQPTAANTKGNLLVNSTTESTDFESGSIVTKGGVGINANLNVGKGGSFRNSVQLGYTLLEDLPTTHERPNGDVPSDILLPDSDNKRNIGNSTKRFANIYAGKFLGNLEGNVSGSVSGTATSASRLVNNTVFTFQGDVETISDTFNGNGAPKSFTLNVAPTFISSKTLASDSLDSDVFLVDRNNGVDSGLRKVSKEAIFANIPGINPVGGMLIWPGISEPTGWKFCNGQELDVAIYALLFDILGYTYNPTPTVGKFALPDLRGRFALGLTNMGNSTPPTYDNRVQNATTIGQVSGSESVNVEINNLPEHEHDLRSETGQQFFAFRETQEPTLPTGVLEGDLEVDSADPASEKIATSGGVNSSSLGEPLNVTNPYMAMNYIIYTGVN